MLKVLLLKPETQQQGGVVNFIATLKGAFSDQVRADDFIIGLRGNRSGLLLRMISTIQDTWHLFKRLKTCEYDVVHVNPSLNPRSLIRDGIFILMMRIMKVRNILVMFHGWDASTANYISNNRFYQWVFVRIFSNAQVILILARAFQNTINDWGFPVEKTRVISTMFNGREMRKFENALIRDNHTVIFLSRLIPEKGIFELLDAFECLADKDKKLRLVVAGDGPSKVEVHERLKSMASRDRVRLTGHIEGETKVHALINSDIFVLPTRHGEGCPVALLEAMASGLAIITTPVGGIPDIIKHKENGLLLDSVTSGSICSAMKYLFADANLLSRIKMVNHQQAWSLFVDNVVATKIEEQYFRVSKLSL